MRILVVGVLACTLGLAACGSSGGSPAAPAFVKATGLPPASHVAANGSSVAADAWGIVRANRSGTDNNVFAVRTTSVVKGDKGALGSVQSLNGPSDVDLGKAVPYYVSVDFATLSGYKLGDVNMNMYGATSTGSDSGFATLSVPSDLEKCATPDDGTYANKYGYIQHRCIVVAAASTAPSTLVFNDPRGSTDVRFELPSP